MIFGGGRVLEAGRLITLPPYRMGAYYFEGYPLIRGYALYRISTVTYFARA